MTARPLRVAVAGASGFVGRSLVAALVARGHHVRRLVREADQADDADALPWDPVHGRLEPSLLEWADAVVNLCGASIAAARWTTAVRADLAASRLAPTRLLARAIGAARRPPKVLVNASATGFYGDRGDDQLDEGDGAGSGFLADLCRLWEEAALAARSDTTRVVLLRFGMVLGRGGALGRMLPIFRTGLGGPLGSGRQWWPWVALADAVEAAVLAVEDDALAGPCNVVAPHAVRCGELCRALGRALGRPAVVPVPAFALRLALGAMADEVLLASCRARPDALAARSFAFCHDTLDAALAAAVVDDA